jgi:SAM-dependent methyltransferase
MSLVQVPETPASTPPRLAYCCPACRGELAWGAGAGTCAGCGQTAAVYADRLHVFLACDSPSTRAVLEWPDDFVVGMRDWLAAIDRKDPLAPAVAAELRRRGVVDAGGGLTTLGRWMKYNYDGMEWHERDERLRSFADVSGLGPEARVLDVGCAAGQALFALDGRRPQERYGIDIDPDGLALGCRLAALRGHDVRFACATAHALPFPDRYFSHIICRGAINYMHQRRALGEIVRVLRPGGFLTVRVERFWHDVHCVTHPRGWKDFVCRSRDLGLGVVHALTGWQPVPGVGRLTVGRGFVTAGWLRRSLRPLGCEVQHVEFEPHCTHWLGMPTQMTLRVWRRA